MEKRVWIQSGVVEELDEKQSRLVRLVLEKIQFYYRELHGTRACYRYPLSLSRLMKLCNRSGAAVVSALRILANTVPAGSREEPPVHYDRVSAERNASHRPYRIFLRRKSDGLHTYVCGTFPPSLVLLALSEVFKQQPF